MQHLGMTQTELADALSAAIEDIRGGATHVSERTVRYLLTGRTRWPQVRTRRALETVFHCSIEELGFVPPSAGHNRQEEPVERRAFFSAAAGVAALPLASGPTRLSISDLARLHVELDGLVADDDRHGGASVENRARSLAEETLNLQKEAIASDRVRSGLYQLAATFTSTAMWAAVDNRRPDRAQADLQRAITLAGLSGDSSIQYRIWSHASILALHRNDWPEAKAAAQAARTAAISRRNPLYASLAHARSAGIHATTGARTAALRSLHFAHDTLDRADHRADRPAWMRFYDTAELAGLSAITHYRLGNAVEAEAQVHLALTRMRPDLTRNRVYYTAYLALAQLEQGDVDQACHTAATVLPQAVGRARKVLDEFTETLTATAPDAAVTRDWQDLRALETTAL